MTIRLGFAMCGSFCTFARVFNVLEGLARSDYDIIPIMSEAAAFTDTRFGLAADHRARMEAITGHKVICSIADAEPIGPKKLLDILIVAPCTGNTLSKLASGITDTSVTMACKAHLRNDRPLLLALSTNDALGANARSLGMLLCRKNHFFVPFGQDEPIGKPASMVAAMERIPDAILAALKGSWLQPLVICGG